jgi:hypothetical protein
MLPAVEFDDQSNLDAREVGEISADGMLTSKPQAAEPTRTQVVPQPVLGIRLISTKIAGKAALVVGEVHAGSMRSEGMRRSSEKWLICANLMEGRRTALTRAWRDLSR